MLPVQLIPESELTGDQIAAIVTLTNSVWPKEGLSLQQRIDELQSAVGSGEREPLNPIRFVVWDGKMAVAHAQVFDRTIQTVDGQSVNILALASVCSDANFRGQGLGAAVVKAAFEQIDQSRPVSLFQTGVPDFYRKFGGRIIDNRFVNRLAEASDANPWWDKHVMIVPASFAWPEGTIDLNGSGY